MANTTHASLYDVQISTLTRELILKVDEAERCQTMLDKLNVLDPNAKLPLDVVDFIGNYAPIEVVGEEGMFNNVKDLIVKALDALMKAISWIIAKLKEIFKYLFDSQYRAKKQILDIQRRILTITMKQDIRTKFENLGVSVVKKSDVDNVIYRTQCLASLITSTAGLTEIQYADVLIKNFKAEAAVELNNEGKFVDMLGEIKPMVNTTFGMAGWKLDTGDGLQAAIVSYLGMIDAIEALKATYKNVDRQASELKQKAEAAATSGAIAGDVVKLQKEAATKIQMTKIMAYAIAIAVRRSDNLLAFFDSVYNELHNITKVN